MWTGCFRSLAIGSCLGPEGIGTFMSLGPQRQAGLMTSFDNMLYTRNMTYTAAHVIALPDLTLLLVLSSNQLHTPYWIHPLIADHLFLFKAMSLSSATVLFHLICPCLMLKTMDLPPLLIVLITINYQHIVCHLWTCVYCRPRPL